MAEGTEVEIEALKLISSEVTDSQLKVILSTECIKGREHLINKLRKRTEKYQEMCSFYFDANSKLQTEIKRAQQTNTSLLHALETIKRANVELRKEWLMGKETKLEVKLRVENGEKKYETLWLQSKARYESLPYVQELLKAKDEVEKIKIEIHGLENVEANIHGEIATKMDNCREIDRKRIVAFVEYLANERPNTINLIKEKSAAISKISEELNNLELKTKDDVKLQNSVSDELHGESDNTSIIPKLHLNYFDFDNLDANLDKIKGEDPFAKTPEKTYSVHSIMVIDPTKLSKKKKLDEDEYISSFFHKPIVKSDLSQPQNYAKKKLINILKDIAVDKSAAQKMILDVNPEELQPINSISIDVHQTVENNKGVANTKAINNSQSEDIEEIDLTASGTEKMILPPTQFLDMTPEINLNIPEKMSQKEEYAEEFNQNLSKMKSSQEQPPKKRVKFELPKKLENKVVNDVEMNETEEEIDANETINSQLDVSDADDGYTKIKDMLMDLSPQFVYAKNVKNPLQNQKQGDSIVTSEFFPQERKQEGTENNPEVVENPSIEEDNHMAVKKVPSTSNEINNKTPKEIVETNIPIEDFQTSLSQKPEITEVEKPIGGLSFGQSTQMTSEFFEESTNTTVFGEGEDLQSLDTSLLLSPKANYTIPNNNDSQEVQSQDLPSFFTGLRNKTAFSFFGCSDSKPDSTAQNHTQGRSGFSFNFGGEEKKNRGGLFSMFQ